MQIPITINYNMVPALAGYLLLQFCNPNERWGFETLEFDERLEVSRRSIDVITDLVPLTLCCEEYAKTDQANLVDKWYIHDLTLEVFLYWQDTQTIVFRHLEEGWILYATYCQDTPKWEWAEMDCWAYDVPEAFYSDDEDKDS